MKNRIIVFLFITLLVQASLNAQEKVVENSILKVDFYSDYPAIKKYIDKVSGEFLYGDYVKEKFGAKVFYQNNSYLETPSIDSITQKNDRICYHLNIKIAANDAASFDFTYILNNTTIELIFDNVKEKEGYKLLYIQSPELLSVLSEQLGAKLVFPENEGRVIDIKSANTGYADIDLSYFGWSRPLLAMMLYHQGLLGVIDYTHLDLKAETRIFNNSNLEKICSLGMTFNYRYAPTDFTNAGFIDVFDSATTSLNVRINILKDYDGNNITDWMDGAKLLRNEVHATPQTNLVKSLTFQSGITMEIQGVTGLLDYIKKIHALTDNTKMYITINGYDNVNGLPMLFGRPEDMTPEVGTIQEIKDVFKIAKESYNTSLGFHDLYTDYYPGTPGYDADVRVINEDGTFAPGWDFPGFSEKYKASLFDYMYKVGFERIQNVLAYYPISDCHYIDALSLIFLKSYSKIYPSSYQKFRRGGQLIIDEFRKDGAMIFSEGVTSSFIGSDNGADYFLGIPRFFWSSLPFGNYEVIPLLEFIYHGKTLYGLRDQHYVLSNQKTEEEAKVYGFLEPLLLGANSNTQLFWGGTLQYVIEKFFLIDMPWTLTNQRVFENYESIGNYVKVTYDNDTFVEVDYQANTYTVQVDGKVIGKNYTTIYPKDQNTFLVFSRDAKTITIPLPTEWSGKIILQKLTEEGVKGNVQYQLVNRDIVFNAEEKTPYKLIRYDAAAISLPEKPNLISPLNKSVNQPSTFLWESTPTPAEFYRLQVAFDSLFYNVVFDDSTITATTKVIEGLNDVSKYYWRVRAKNSCGTGVWSTFWSFIPNEHFEADIKLGSNSIGNGIQLVCNEGESVYQQTVINNSPCVYNLLHNTGPVLGMYLYFNIDDNLVYEGNNPNCWITIEYYDTLSTDQIWLTFDGQGNSDEDKFKFSSRISNTNTRKWKTYTFKLTDASFGNHENCGSDFRLGTYGVMFIRRVYISSNGTYNYAPIVPTLVYPTEASIKSPVKLKFDWSNNLRASNYHFQLSKDPLFNTKVYNDSTLTDSTKLFDNLEINTQYYWRVKSINLAIQSDWSPVWSFTTNSSTDVKTDEIPTVFSLSHNYPNPFNPTTTFKFGIPKESKVKFEVYNIIGQRIVQLMDEIKAAGYYSVNWNGSNFASGVYVYKLEAISTSSGEIFRDVKKMILMK